MLSLMRFWMNNFFSTPAVRKAPRRTNNARLSFEALEDRTVPSGTPLVGPFLPSGSSGSGAAITTSSSPSGPTDSTGTTGAGQGGPAVGDVLTYPHYVITITGKSLRDG